MGRHLKVSTTGLALLALTACESFEFSLTLRIFGIPVVVPSH